MSQPPRGLGRGLSAILGDISGADDLRKPVTYQDKNKVGSPASPRTTADVFRVPTSQISPNPYQPRLSFDSEELEGLAASIRTLGLITPITVRKIAENRYQIISGERRYRACQMVGMTEIPAYIRETDDHGMLEMAIVENVQRENLDPIEVALSYQRLLTECNLTQEQMADRLGKNRSSVANQIRLLKLPVKVQHDLKVGQISVGHAKVLLSIDDPDLQSKLCDYTIKNALNVRQLEQKVKALLAKDNTPAEKPKAAEGASVMPELHKDLCREVAKYFKGKISLKRNDDGKGSITINFSSDAEVNRFLDAIKNS